MRNDKIIAANNENFNLDGIMKNADAAESSKNSFKSQILNGINNQCSIVQHSIAKNYDFIMNEGLIDELHKLHDLIKAFFAA